MLAGEAEDARRKAGQGNPAVQAADIVITMGCGDAHPVYPGRRYLGWTRPGSPSSTSALSATRTPHACALLDELDR